MELRGVSQPYAPEDAVPRGSQQHIPTRARRKVAITDIVQEPFERIDALGLRLDTRSVVNNRPILLELVADGVGVALVPDASPPMAGVTLVDVQPAVALLEDCRTRGVAGGWPAPRRQGRGSR